MKKSVIEAASSEKVVSSASDRARDSNSLPTGAYMSALPECLHEVLFLHEPPPFENVTEAQCATVDTGCQRTAVVGLNTLRKFTEAYPEGVEAVYKAEAHNFKSINGVTSTSQVACLPTSLGCHGSILRPAVFDDDKTRDAPFLISLPFLLHCRASIQLDPEEGLCLHLKRFNHRVPLHIGPTGALRVPLQQFESGKNAGIKEALNHAQMNRKCITWVPVIVGSVLITSLLAHLPVLIFLMFGSTKRGRTETPTPMQFLEFMVILNAAHQAALSMLCVRGPEGALYRQVAGTLRQPNETELRSINRMIGQTLSMREQAEHWDSGEPWPRTPSPTATSTSTGSFVKVDFPGDPIEMPRAAIRCFCGLPVVILETKKEGRNHGRQFRRCPRWQMVELRRDYFQRLEHQPNWKTSRGRVGSRPIEILRLRHFRDGKGTSQPHPNSGRRHRTSCHSWRHRDQWLQVWDQLRGLRTRAHGIREVWPQPPTCSRSSAFISEPRKPDRTSTTTWW